MFRGGLDPRQVPIQGLEGRCNAFLDEISKLGVCRYMLLDADFLGESGYEFAIPHPLSFQTIRAKLAGAGAARPGQGAGRGQGGKYLYANEFAFDVRRVLGNFLRYNFDLKARRSSADVLLRFEQWWAALQQELQASAPGHFYFQQPLPELRWLLAAYDELVKIKVPAASGKKQEARLLLTDFNAPITYYMAGEQLQNYLALVPSPICYGDIVSAAVESDYADLASLKAAVSRIHANCAAFWSQKEGGQAVIDDALRLEKALLGSLESSAQTLASGDPKALELLSAGEAGADRGSAPAPKLKSKTGARAGAIASPTFSKSKLKASSPPYAPSAPSAAAQAAVERKAQKLFKALLSECMTGVEMHNLVYQSTAVLTAAPFMAAVDTAAYPDYALLIKEPMDLGKINRRIQQDTYSVLGGIGGPDRGVASVLRDIGLLRSNTHEYNKGSQSADVRVMADHVAAYFRHTLKVGLRLLADRGDTAMAHYVLSGPGTAALLAEPDANIVVAYVRRMEYDVPSILVVTLGSLLGTKTTPAPPSAKKAPKKQNDAYADYGGGEMIDEVYDNEDEWKGGGGKKGKKNKRASEASTNAVEVMEVEAEAEVEPEGAGEWAWVEAACKVHAALQKHPFVDYRQPATMASNFWNPVVELYPSIAEDYLSIIEQPMDMTTLYNTLVQLHFASPEAFVQAAVAIFQNAIMYNGGHSESDLAQRLVPRCELLVQYTRWMALDKLPLADTGTVEEAETEGGEGRTILTLSVHKAEARVREGLIKSAPLPLGLPPGKAQIAAILVKKECVRLLDAVRRSRNRAEKIEVSYFDLPVDVAQITDYSVYVRRPADFSTVRYRLEGVLPGDLRVRGLMDMGARPYKTVGDFLEEVRRIFSNAAKYNQPKRATDPVSDAVFLAAERLRERFETLLCTTSVTLAELQERRRILSTDSAKLELESLAVREREQARDRENYARLMEDKIRNDPSLARDRNTVQRIKESEAQAEAHRAAQQERSRSGAMEGPVGADDALRQGGSMEEQTYSAPQATETAYLGALGGPMVCGFGVGGTFPRKFAYQAQLKRRTLQRTRAEAVQRLEREQEERKRRAEKQKEQSVPRNRQREGGLDREQMGREQAQAQERQTVVGAFSLKGWRGRLKGANSVFTFVDDGSSH